MIFLTGGLLKVMDYQNYMMHNSPALDVFDMWSVKSYGLLELGVHNSAALDVFDMWSSKSYGLLELGDA